MPPFNEIYEANNLETIGTNIHNFSKQKQPRMELQLIPCQSVGLV